MGPILFLIGAGLVLAGCSGAQKSTAEAPPLPPPPPDPDCSGSAYGLKAGAPGLFPCAALSKGTAAYFSSPPTGKDWSPGHKGFLDSVLEDMRHHGTDIDEAMNLARRISPPEGTLSFRPSQKSQILGLAALLLEAKNTEAGSFRKEYGALMAKVLDLVQAGKLKVRFAPSGALTARYDSQNDTLELSDAIHPTFSPELKSRWLGALYDFALDSRGNPAEMIVHAFERSTLQGLYLMESAGVEITQLSGEELAQWQKKFLTGNAEAPFLTSALNAFYFRSHDSKRRFAQLDFFADRYENQLLYRNFRRNYEQAAENSPFRESWDEMTKEDYRPTPLPVTKIQADIQKLEKLRKVQLESLRKAVDRARKISAAEDKKHDLIMRSHTAEEIRANSEVKNRLDALTVTWANLSFQKDLLKNAEYILKEITPALRPEEEYAEALGNYRILSKQSAEYNGLR